MAKNFAFRRGLSVDMRHPVHGNVADDVERHAKESGIPYDVMSAGMGTGELLFKSHKDRTKARQAAPRGTSRKFEVED